MRKLFFLVLTVAPGLAYGAELPPDIATFLDRVSRCERAARLESYESERRDQVHQAYEDLGCRNLMHDEAQLRTEYGDDPSAMAALDAARQSH